MATSFVLRPEQTPLSSQQYGASLLLQNDRENMLQKIRGQVVRIPDLRPLMAGWPSDVNPHRQTIKAVIDDILERYSMSAAMTAKLKRANLDYLLAVWYPYADEATLKDLTYFCGWMFLVDDEIDQVSRPGSDNEIAFAALYQETLGFVERSLKLGNETEDKTRSSTNATAESFGRIGEALCNNCTIDQRQMFLDEARLTLDGYRYEQQLRLKKKIPNFEQYWTYREGSSCCRQVVAMIEFASHLHIPHDIMLGADMRSLWKETCLVHWITNDIVSAKKEIAEGFVENLTVICSGPTGSAQQGMNIAVNLLKASIKRLEVAASNLWLKYCFIHAMQPMANMIPGMETEKSEDRRSREELSRAIEIFIANCKNMCVGNLDWSIASPRYGLQDIERDAEGGLSFVLGQ